MVVYSLHRRTVGQTAYDRGILLIVFNIRYICLCVDYVLYNFSRTLFHKTNILLYVYLKNYPLLMKVNRLTFILP